MAADREATAARTPLGLGCPDRDGHSLVPTTSLLASGTIIINAPRRLGSTGGAATAAAHKVFMTFRTAASASGFCTNVKTRAGGPVRLLNFVVLGDIGKPLHAPGGNLPVDLGEHLRRAGTVDQHRPPVDLHGQLRERATIRRPARSDGSVGFMTATSTSTLLVVRRERCSMPASLSRMTAADSWRRETVERLAEQIIHVAIAARALRPAHGDQVEAVGFRDGALDFVVDGPCAPDASRR